jgi:DNA-binding NarL/FixJ family response regulator
VNPGDRKIRVLLVDDHAALLEPLAFMFEQEPDFAVVGMTSSLREARDRLVALARGGDVPDVAIVDMNLPDGEGTSLIGDLRTSGFARGSASVLILTAIEDPARLAPAVEAGAAGILHKSAGTREIIDAARRLAAGEVLLSQGELRAMLRLASSRREQDLEAGEIIDRLTPREREVLQALAEGLSDAEIAGKLYVTAGTVRTHFANILAKLQTTSRLQALVLAARHGIVRIGRGG